MVMFTAFTKNTFLIGAFVCLILLLTLGTGARPQDKKRIVLESELLGVSQFLPGVVFQMYSVADFLLVKHKQEDTFLTLIDLKNPKENIIHTGIIGLESGQLYNPGTVVTEGRSFSVLNDRTLITFDLDSILQDQRHIPKSNPIALPERPVINVTKVGKFHYVSNEVNIESRFSLLNAQGKSIYEFGEFPEDSSIRDDNPAHVNNVAYQSELASNCKLQRMAAATRYGEYIAFFQMDLEKGVAEIFREYLGELPIFEVNGTYGPNFGLNSETKAGYLSLVSDESFIFALFSGKTIRGGGQEAYTSDFIQVFNWDGEEIATLQLDKKVSGIAINNGVIFGLLESGNGYDIAKFNLDKKELFY